MTKDFSYSGKPKDLDRKIGENFDDSIAITNTQQRLDQRTLLLSRLDKFIALLDSYVSQLKTKLSETAVLVPEKSRIREALDAEESKDLLSNGDKVSFLQYLMLEKKHSSSAIFLRTYYVKNMHFSLNASAFDSFVIYRSILDETKHMKNFVIKYIQEKNGQEKGITYKLFQDWVNVAVELSTELWNQIENKKDNSIGIIDGVDLAGMTPDLAKRTQAAIHGKINALNNIVNTNVNYISKSYGDASKRFYEDFVGPAISHREKVTSKLQLKRDHSGTPFYKELDSSAVVYDNNLKSALADQMIRNNNFETYMKSIISALKVRDQYLYDIEELSSLGSQTPSLIVIHKPTEYELNQEKNYEGTKESIFKASHNFLDDLDNPDAHSQYLLKDGGIITGNINVDEGVTIDGVDISLHTHNGQDGSQRIDARDLVEGTLGIASINTAEQVVRPKNLRFINQASRLNAATALVDLTLSWEGDSSNTFEFQIAPVKTQTNVSVSSVYNIKEKILGSKVPESSSGIESFKDLCSNYLTNNGSDWYYFLANDSDSDGKANYNRYGFNDGVSRDSLYLYKSSGNNDTEVLRGSILDATNYSDLNIKHSKLTSSLWVLRSDNSAIVASRNRLLKIDGTTTLLKSFASDGLSYADIYNISINKTTDEVYFMVKISDYSVSPIKSNGTTIELWKISSSNSLSKLYSWENQTAVDDYTSDNNFWYSDAVNDVDFSLINTGVVKDGYIYGFCLYNLNDSDFYHSPSLSNNVLPVLCRFSLATKKKEIIKAHDNSYILCFGGKDYQSPQPVWISDTMYMPGNVVLSKETINNTTTLNSIVSLNAGVFSRQYFVTQDSSRVYYRNCATDNDGNLYALGIFDEIDIDVGEKLGAIYLMDGS